MIIAGDSLRSKPMENWSLPLSQQSVDSGSMSAVAADHRQKCMGKRPNIRESSMLLCRHHRTSMPRKRSAAAERLKQRREYRFPNSPFLHFSHRVPGGSFTTNTRFGTLKAARFCLHPPAMIAPPSSSSRLGHDHCVTASPKSGCGKPMTALSTRREIRRATTRFLRMNRCSRRL